MKTGAYRVGYNGHARICDCSKCARSRASALLRMIRQKERMDPVYKEGAEVFVQGHFRRAPNYLRRAPNTRYQLSRLLSREF